MKQQKWPYDIPRALKVPTVTYMAYANIGNKILYNKNPLCLTYQS